MIKHIFSTHLYCISRGLIKKLQLYGTNTNNVAAAAAERGVYNRPVYFSISTPPSNWLIKQSYLAAERARRANATLLLKLDSLLCILFVRARSVLCILKEVRAGSPL